MQHEAVTNSQLTKHCSIKTVPVLLLEQQLALGDMQQQPRLNFQQYLTATCNAAKPLHAMFHVLQTCQL